MGDLEYNSFKLMSEGLMKSIECIATVFSGVHNWVQTYSENILAYISLFKDLSVAFSANKIMADKQIIFTDDLSLDFAQKIYDSTNADDVIQQYYFQDNELKMCQLIDRCKNSKQLQNHKEYYCEIIEAYKQNSFRLSCTGLFALIDGVLADTLNITKTSFSPRINIIKEKINNKMELNVMERKIWLIYEAIDSFDTSIFADSDFSKSEPNCLNRHWIMHGRTKRTYTRYDVLKTLLWLDAIIYLDNVNTEFEELNNENTTATSC